MSGGERCSTVGNAVTYTRDCAHVQFFRGDLRTDNQPVPINERTMYALREKHGRSTQFHYSRNALRENNPGAFEAHIVRLDPH